jgi:bacillithiol system protein YtxJ
MINWIPLESEKQLNLIAERSNSVPCLIFKHSTTCEISAMAKHRLETKWNFGTQEVEPYYLDLLKYRPVSREIAEKFEVHHESPQVLLIHNGECVYDASHLDISVAELRACYADAVQM